MPFMQWERVEDGQREKIPMLPLHDEPAMNFGRIVQGTAVVLSIAGLVWWQSSFQAKTEQRLQTTETVHAQYIPVIDSVSQTQAVINLRLRTLDDSLNDLRSSNRELLSEVVKMRERLMSIETTLKNGGPKL